MLEQAKRGRTGSTTGARLAGVQTRGVHSARYNTLYTSTITYRMVAFARASHRGNPYYSGTMRCQCTNLSRDSGYGTERLRGAAGSHQCPRVDVRSAFREVRGAGRVAGGALGVGVGSAGDANPAVAKVRAGGGRGHGQGPRDVLAVAVASCRRRWGWRRPHRLRRARRWRAWRGCGGRGSCRRRGRRQRQRRQFQRRTVINTIFINISFIINSIPSSNFTVTTPPG